MPSGCAWRSGFLRRAAIGALAWLRIGRRKARRSPRETPYLEHVGSPGTFGLLGARRMADDRLIWEFRRTIDRVVAVDDVMADYATNWCGRPFRRINVFPFESAIHVPGVRWSIEGQLVAEFVVGERGHGALVVHDIALLAPLRRAIRSRRVRIERPAFDRT